MSELCEYCGEPYELDLLDVYTDERAFLFTTCCETVYNDALDELQGGTRAAWLRDLFAGYGIDVRQVYADDCGGLRLDYGLELRAIAPKDARAFIAKHHRHNKPPTGWKWTHAAYNGAELVGVATVGRPVARMLDANTIVEVTRLCVDPDAPRALVWNACSMLYAAARNEAKRRGYQAAITYTLEGEHATSLKAAGWTRNATTRGGSWNVPSRPRQDTAPTCAKIRWVSLLTQPRL